jgi:flagellar basal-body rod modification protein FlgD
MVDPVNNVSRATAPAPTPTLTKAAGDDKEMGRDAFLKLLVAQLKNQDPLNPQESSEFVAQLAQFSSLEQTVGINTRLDQLALQNQGLQNSQVVALVGKQATVKGNIVALKGQGQPVAISFKLNGPAKEASVVIRDQSGRTVRTLEVSARAAGNVTVAWNGQNDTGLPQPAGPYQVTVTAKSVDDLPVTLTQQSSGTVSSVSFEQGFPVLQLDSGVTAPVGDLVSVSPSLTNP